MTSRVRKPVEAAIPHSDEDSQRAEKAERERRWLSENAEAIRLENERIERDGLPLAKYRLF